ncbi:hypothetical protein RvY_00644 [Ramazzottius varieornatus]|uniref:Anoctamin n=1 Tax=Ramazzottius varieornatus TaxID=947166 RepID=A0A1D1UNV4_RAMVA|nr:hypothetical protein RvY_00644 [Ramazzottius varieornatus]
MAGSDTEDQGSEPFETHCVIELSTRCHEDLIHWMVHRITSPKSAGGAELHVKTVRDVDTNQCRYLHISAPFYRLMETAEWLEMMKPDLTDNHALKEFTVKTLPKFVNDDHPYDQLFTYAEKARMVFFEVFELRAQEHELERFWHINKLRFTLGQSIFTKVQRKELINQIYSLHNKEDLKVLGAEWLKVSLLKKQPLGHIRDYFGEHIAVYFAFLGYYTEMLVPATLLGILMFFVQFISTASLQAVAAFAVFNLLWGTFFLERWKRHCNRLAYNYGMLHKSSEELEIPRAQYKGQMGRNEITGMPEPTYPNMNRYLWIAFVSTPIVSLCLLMTVYILNTYLNTQLRLNHEYAIHPTAWLFFYKFVPSGIYTTSINVFRAVYKYVATWLTDKENHRLESEYEFNLIWKLLLFNFINSFASLFYIAFWLQDLDLLRSHLAAQLITNQIIDQVPETIVPFIKVRYDKWRLRKDLRKEAKKRDARGENEDPNFEFLRDQAIVEGHQPPYLGTFDDYLELFLQFGFCFLFSSVFPIAPLFALINNLVEVRGDGFKLCNIMQRPFARPASDIGPWQVAFELMGFAAVITNLALIFLGPTTKSYFPTWTTVELLIAFVVVEHVLICVKLGMSSIIPTIPREISIAMAKNEYDMKRALKEGRAKETRKEIEERKMSRRVSGWVKRNPSSTSGDGEAYSVHKRVEINKGEL